MFTKFSKSLNNKNGPNSAVDVNNKKAMKGKDVKKAVGGQQDEAE